MLRGLKADFGERWFLEEAALARLKKWAAVGSSCDIHEFMRNIVGMDMDEAYRDVFPSDTRLISS